MEQIITVKKFNNEDDFIAFLQILDENNIFHESEIFNSTIDPATFRPVEKDFVVRVKQSDFIKVNKILDEIALNNIQNVDKDHYLFSFSDSELYDILAKPDEWSAFDYHLAKKVLKEKGKNIDEEFLHSLKKARLEHLYKPEESQSTWIIIGYIMAFFGGLGGLAIGWHIMSYQKTLPNGEKIYVYQEKDRKNGKIIFYIGLVTLPVMLFLRIYTDTFSK